MPGSLTVIGGHSGPILTGLVSIPSAFSSDINGSATQPGSLQYLLSIASGLVTTGLVNLTNFDAAASSTFSTSPSVSGPTLYEITDTDSTGAVTTVTGGVSITAFTVPVSVSGLIVEAPGFETVTGNGTTSLALFGANSNVDYSVLTGSGSIYAAGGADSISIGAAGDTPSYLVYSAGNDTVNLVSGIDSVIATTATTTLLLGTAEGFATAEGNSTVSVVFQPLSAGTLNFVNNSSGAATIYTGAYSTPGGGKSYAENNVTAFGGAGGGFYVGGHGGDNSLVGGTGVVTLQGGGNGDYLEANSSTGGGNQLFSGPGAETLIGSSTSGSNTFQLNLRYVGIGTITGQDMVSTDGSGAQNYLLGAGDSTITGSTVAGSSNTFDLIRDASVGSAVYTITNFASLQGGNFYITDGSQAGGSSSIQSTTTVNFGTVNDPNYVTTVLLTDQTEIKFDGVQASQLTEGTTGSGIITINFHS